MNPYRLYRITDAIKLLACRYHVNTMFDHLATTRRVNLGAYVNQDLAERLGELAQRNERSKSAELRLALRAWLDQHPPQQEISPIANATTATH